MSYIVFARKWRPKTFDEIIGQSHITQTLKNAIKNDRVAHAYIFAGPRGIGKTSAARILAKALNCEKGPAPEPCNRCTSCTEISESRSLDVLEIDGASNRGIDDIRNLRENIKFAPTLGKFKLYIIDEVHMLTQEAFNALLKTLEEPPPHVKFIFATTQPNKVLPTILSRCQRFDFRKISIKEIVRKLAHISKEEDLKITEDALFALARAADGSMRDAESVLDQLSSFANKKIEIADVTHVLGTLDEEILFEIVDTIAKKDTPRIMKMVDDLVKKGKDVSLIALELLGHFRDLLVAKMGKNLKDLIDLPEDSISKLSRQGEDFTIEDLLYTLNTLSNAHDMMRRSNLTRIPLEIALIKLSKRSSIYSIEEILGKVSSLEEKISQHRVDEEAFIPERAVKSDEGVKTFSPEEGKEEIKEAAKKEAGQEGDISLKQIEHIWPNLIKKVRLKKISIASCLLEGEPTSYQEDTLTLGFPEGFSFHKEVLEKVDNRKIIEESIREILGKAMTLKFATIGKKRNTNNNIGLDETLPEEPVQEGPEPDAGAHKDSIVGSALDIFKGRIINNKKQKG